MEKKKTTKLKKTSNADLFAKYVAKVKSLNKEKNIDDIYLSLLNGKNSYLRYQRYESSLFDSSWIPEIEGVLYDLGEIINNPRSVTMQESNVVPVELAKKIDGESVQHLASHTQFIKDIDEEQNVIPSKILSHSNEDNMNTYENRFIATFIRRLVLFVEKRYEYLERMFPLHSEDIMYIKNSTFVNGEEVEIETKVRVKREVTDDVAIQNKEYLERIKKMREYIFYYYNSPFMKRLKNERDVRKPILQTNIIRKNLKYNHCFRVFMYLEKFGDLGVNYNVDERFIEYSSEDLAELNYLNLSEYLAVQNIDEFTEVKKSSKTYKPKVMLSIDDEKFTFGEPLTGTLEFVRVDEEYRNYLNAQGEIGLPLHPDKWEKLYYKNEYQLKKAMKKEFEEIEKLLRRKVREDDDWQKYVEKVLERVAIEDREEERRRLEAIVNEELALVEKKRKEIIEAAKNDQGEMKAVEKERIRRDKIRERQIRERERLEKEERERLAKEEENRRLALEQSRLEQERLEKERLELEEKERQEEARRLEEERIFNEKRLEEERFAEQQRIAEETRLAIEKDKKERLAALEKEQLEKDKMLTDLNMHNLGKVDASFDESNDVNNQDNVEKQTMNDFNTEAAKAEAEAAARKAEKEASINKVDDNIKDIVVKKPVKYIYHAKKVVTVDENGHKSQRIVITSKSKQE